jgi:hypothetical protein
MTTESAVLSNARRGQHLIVLGAAIAVMGGLSWMNLRVVPVASHLPTSNGVDHAPSIAIGQRPGQAGERIDHRAGSTQIGRNPTAAVTSGTAASASEGGPCTRAHAPEFGDPLGDALKTAGKHAPKPGDSSWYREAVAKAERATSIDPGCAEAWSILAYARYRLAYDICGAGDYGAAEEAARKAIALASEPPIKAAATRNLGRIAAARLNWDGAERLFGEAKTLNPDNREAKMWSDELSVRRAARPVFLAAVAKVLAGELLTDGDLAPITAEEVTLLINAPLARLGRRLNSGTEDWFYFCDGSPVQNRPKMNPGAPRNPVAKKSADDGNMKMVAAFRKRLHSGGGLPVIAGAE